MAGDEPPTPLADLDIEAHDRTWALRLYIAGQTVKSLRAVANLRRICAEELDGEYRVEVIDLSEHPHLARSDNIVAMPTLVRVLPRPMRRVIGDLSETEQVLVGLELTTR